ncbi:16989_t:CDS:2 [Rhizophagus irregularis]|nr:16989_t:CDS:2 [Rhizophagus irregularis]
MYGLLSFENANGPATDVFPKDAKSSVTKTSDSADPGLMKDS